MVVALGLLSVLAFIISFLLLVINVFRRKPKKKAALGMFLSVAVFIASLYIMGSDSNSEAQKPLLPEETALPIETTAPEEKEEIEIAAEDSEIDHAAENIVDAFNGSSTWKPLISAVKNESGLYDVTSIYTEAEERHSDVRWCAIDFCSVLDGVKRYHPEELEQVSTFTASFKGTEYTYVATVDTKAYDSEGTIEFLNVDEPNSEKILVDNQQREQAKADFKNENAGSNAQQFDSDEGLTEVTSEAERVLMTITEDVAKQIAQNPGTVSFKTMYWGFARNGHIYCVQGTFECSNLMGVTEEHDLQVWCEANEDYSKIQPYEVYLDGQQIA